MKEINDFLQLATIYIVVNLAIISGAIVWLFTKIALWIVRRSRRRIRIQESLQNQIDLLTTGLWDIERKLNRKHHVRSNRKKSSH